MSLDKIALGLVILGFAVWSSVLLLGMIAAWPFGIPLLAVGAVAGYLLYSVIRDRMNNEEDDYYEKNVDQ